MHVRGLLRCSVRWKSRGLNTCTCILLWKASGNIEKWQLWKASGEIENQQWMANGPANRGSPFSIRCAVSYLFCPMFSIHGYSMFAAPFAIRHAVRHSPRQSPRLSPFAAPFAAPFPIYFPQFSLLKLRYSMFAAPLAIRSSSFANRRAIRIHHSPRHSLSPFNVPWRFP